jgi:beta-lactam-binding protein with PASTA domain
MKKWLNYSTLILIPILSLLYIVYIIADSKVNGFNINTIVSSVILILFILGFLFMSFKILEKESKNNKVIVFVVSCLLVVFLGFNILTGFNIVKLPEAKILDSFVNESITDVIDWASENNIEIEQFYEYSDTTLKNSVIRQDIKEGTLLKDVKKIEIVVSNGPNYDQTVIVPSMIGWNIDEVVEFINTNHIIGLDIDYVESIEEKDIVIEQDKSGELKRNEEFKLTLSLGEEESTEPVLMINLKNKLLFEGLLFLKRNAIKYTLVYAYSNTIERGKIISQDKEVDYELDKEDTVLITVSKGKEITVPDILNMSVSEITKWIVSNNLKIEFENRYDDVIAIGNIIESSVEKDEKIEEETLIEIVVSKGQLKMQEFDSVAEFRDWATDYNINYKEEYEFNSLSKGSIIRFSHEANQKIMKDDIVTIYISNGTPVTVPNFVGKTKSNITSSCNSLGLNCTFYYSNYSSTAKDTALTQNKKSGSQVVNGTYVSIGLSKGSALSFTVQFNESQLSFGNPDATISTLRTWVTNQYPGVTFTFSKKTSSVYENGGFIHESSPIRDGSRVTQGNSYQIWITTN